MIRNKTGFTLVELIVVVTILAILGTIGFVSYANYLKGVRDSNRTSQIAAISDGLHLYATNQPLPLPDNAIQISSSVSSGSVIAYQGYAGSSVLEIIDYSKQGLDPKDKLHFTYYITADQKHHQLMAFLERIENTQAFENIFSQVYATDYSKRHPTLAGRKLGILTDTSSTPIQELIFTDDTLDLSTNTGSYNSLLSDDTFVTGSGGILVNGAMSAMIGKKKRSCKEIRDTISLSAGIDGYYWINPTGNKVFQVYCDMSNDEGGWTLVANVTDYSGRNHVDAGAVNIDDGYVSPFSYTTQKLSDETINLFRSQSNYLGTTAYRMSCWKDTPYEDSMYCSSDCNFSAIDSPTNTACALCGPNYEGTLTQLSTNHSDRGLGHSYVSPPESWMMGYGVTHRDGCVGQYHADGRDTTSDGLLWVK